MKNLLMRLLSLLPLLLGGNQSADAGETAQQLKIEGATKYKAGQLVRLRAVGVPKEAGLLWFVSPESSADVATTEPELCEFAGVPGTYSVTLVAFTPGLGRQSMRRAVLSVTIEGDSSAPSPRSPGSPTSDPDAALGKLVFGLSGCTACPIEPRNPDGTYDLLTAAHCCPGVGTVGTFTSQEGQRVAVQVVAHHPESDLAWIRTRVAPALPLKTAVLARQLPAVGSQVMQAGYNVSASRVKSYGEFLGGPNVQGLVSMRLRVDEGDSGGPVWVVSSGEVIAAVCCTQKVKDKVPMYGGSCLRAWELRPRQQVADAGEEWRPVPMPTVRPSPAGSPAGAVAASF